MPDYTSKSGYPEDSRGRALVAGAETLARLATATEALKLAADGLESNGLGQGGDILISEEAWRAVHAALAKIEGGAAQCR